MSAKAETFTPDLTEVPIVPGNAARLQIGKIYSDGFLSTRGRVIDHAGLGAFKVSQAVICHSRRIENCSICVYDGCQKRKTR